MTEDQEPQTEGELSGPELLRAYRTMFASRCIDDREKDFQKQGKVFFQISGAGHEALNVGIAPLVRPGSDWFYLYYRDRALALALGLRPVDHFRQTAGRITDPSGAGRQMPAHFGHAELNIVCSSSPTGMQFLQAVGTAEAGLRAERQPRLRKHAEPFASDGIVLCCAGEGATSEGEFWEAMNTASNLKLPVVFVIEDNEYAISVPVEVQTAGGSISKLVSNFPDLLVTECDGTSVEDSRRAAGKAIAWCRARRGPALLHAHTTRPYSHSASDDEALYRTPAERKAQDARDPLLRTRNALIERGAATEEELDALEREVREEVVRAADEALQDPEPPPEHALKWLYAETGDPTTDEFRTAPQSPSDKPYTMVDLLNRCLAEEMERDPRIVVFGQDVADASREASLAEVSGKGGVFKVTHGLQRRFGANRVYNAPLAEANIVGRGLGMAIRGLRPVVEIQFFDYIWPAFMQIRNELATLSYRSAGTFSAPMVIRTTYGGYIKGGIYHSQTGATLFAQNPGLRVVLPSNAADASGLLRTAIRCNDPVLFLEHKHLYRQVHSKSLDPGSDYMIPFGRAKVVREGSDLTVVTFGATVKRSLDAARTLQQRFGVSLEVIDLRSLSPLDAQTVERSVRRTNRALVVHEDAVTFGIGGEIAARIADRVFPWLDAPVRRVGSLDTWVGYAPSLERVVLPTAETILEAALELVEW